MASTGKLSSLQLVVVETRQVGSQSLSGDKAAKVIAEHLPACFSPGAYPIVPAVPVPEDCY